MTSSNRIIFHVTGLLCREFTGPQWIPRTKASDADFWCFLCTALWINGWETIVRPLWRYCNDIDIFLRWWHINTREPWHHRWNFISDFEFHISGPIALWNPTWCYFQHKDSVFQYWKSHRGNKTVSRPFCLHDEIPCTGKKQSLRWTASSARSNYEVNLD